MAIPLTVAIVALCGLIGLLTWLYVRLQARYDALAQQFMDMNGNYMEYVTKSAEKMTRDVPKMADKMLDSLADSVQGVTKGMSDAMQAIYGPVRVEQQQTEASMGDIATPWYGAEGSLDFTDPTDGLLVADPVEYPEGGSNLIMDGDDEPFGIPGLKLGMEQGVD